MKDRNEGSGSGLFFAFEGIDGAGKTTQALRLKDRLEKSGRPALYVKEPTDGVWGRKVREIAQKGRAGVTLEQELEYFIRDRDQDVRENIRPALIQGQVVIADRYFYSTIAYQSALGLDREEIRRRNLGFPVPDLVFLPEISIELSQERITQGRGETANLGYEQADFLARVKAVFDSLTDPNLVRFPGDQTVDETAEFVWSRVRPLLDKEDS